VHPHPTSGWQAWVGLPVYDLENDIFVNPSYLVDLPSSIYFGGWGVRTYCSEYLTYPNAERQSIFTMANNPSFGAAIPVSRHGTSVALAVGGDFSDAYMGRKNNYLVNLRLGQKVGRFGLGAGIDESIYNGNYSTQLLLGALIGNPANRLSLNARTSDLSSERINISMDLKWQYQCWQWLGFGLLGGAIWDQSIGDRVYDTGAGIKISINPLRTSVYGDLIVRWRYQQIWSVKQDSLIPWYYNRDQIVGKQLELCLLGRVGLETQAVRFLSLRVGLSSWGTDLSVTPFSTVYEPRQVTYTTGASYVVRSNIKLEYAFNGNFESYTNSSSDRQRHYLKITYTK
jgi:hypothetical protein